MRLCFFALFLGSTLCLSACYDDPGPRRVDNPDLRAKIPAIKEDVRNKRLDDVHQLVKDLDSDDSAVRFYAIQGLGRLTGETFGYRYYDDEDHRKPAVQQWQKWLKQQPAGK